MGKHSFLDGISWMEVFLSLTHDSFICFPADNFITLFISLLVWAEVLARLPALCLLTLCFILLYMSALSRVVTYLSWRKPPVLRDRCSTIDFGTKKLIPFFMVALSFSRQRFIWLAGAHGQFVRPACHFILPCRSPLSILHCRAACLHAYYFRNTVRPTTHDAVHLYLIYVLPRLPVSC